MIEKFRLALRKNANAKLERILDSKNDIDSSPLNSSVWPLALYQKEISKKITSLNHLLREEQSFFDGLFLSNWTGWLALFNRTEKLDIELIDLTASDEFSMKVTAALNIIQRSWPEAYVEMKTVLRGFAGFKSDSIENFSDPQLYGIIHLNVKLSVDEYTLACDIIHEIAHHTLFMQQSVDQFIVDKSSMLFSPIREENRPAIGLLHAIFAMGRMIEFANRLLVNNDSAKDREAAENIKNKNMTNLSKSIQILKTIEITDATSKILAEAESLLHA
jgi:hypothetical protein